MKRWLVQIGVLVLAVAVAAACAGTATATPVATAMPTSTPSPAKEWALDGILVDRSTVTVTLAVFAGIDVWATLDGEHADEVRATPPTIEYVFQNIAAGQHTVELQDVVGYDETAEVVVPVFTVPPSPPARFAWLADLVHKLEKEPVANPPALIEQYQYGEQTVYFLPQRCCDIFSDLYDAEGDLIGRPDGGITGQGDGRVPDFFDAREYERTIWADQRTFDQSLVQVPAPIESVEILILESFPPQYNLVVVSGLPNLCVSFGGYRLERDGGTIRAEMINWKPADPDVKCAMVYGIVTTTIPLGSEFEPGKSYAVSVGDVSETFVAQ